MSRVTQPLFCGITLCICLTAVSVEQGQAAVDDRIPVTISGGHETDPRDHGRPVILIANALGVTAEIFRDAFSRVHPAPAGTEPDPAQVRRNKTALMESLAPFHVTNERLDQVSNYYRYPPGGEHLWTQRPATAYATVEHGAVTAIVITNAGAGYSSMPAVTVAGHPEVALKATLAFDTDVTKNGSITSITVGK